MSELYTAFNFKKWIDDHRDLLKPPVGNKMVWPHREFIVMVVGGPNTRTDYHVNEGEEFFYQLEGDMTLKIIDHEGKFRDIPICEGDIYLLPGGVPHSPQRPAGTIGLVVERQRRPEENDGLQWYCKECGNKLYEEFFHLENIETQFGAVFDRYYGNPDHYVCKKCGSDNGKSA
ncbi:MAG: 3-hydroxyanthranilate 3,4-dioxygenase [Pseudobdellovibrionaceae bacterium]|nr:3-hydroxyanthranilate 3,4-dioxygenase [Bdellovibrionales bacterium]USN48692.1 MAG: 3-hydroxyanthranilate 3,4-dioxygenase [Pseudobdellovibrionaceae bacterium]